jgi:3-dehydroquinate dehydratase-2
MAPLVLVLNGPNLNLLGTREPEVYGRETLADVEALCRATAAELGVETDVRQTNHEGVLVDWIQEARGRAAGIVINPGAYTHTSIAIPDALRAVGLPAIELHLSNVFARESFRHHSHVSPVARAVMCGFGVRGYEWAIRALTAMLRA